MRMPKGLGMILLGIWLIVMNLLQVLSISIAHIGVVMALLGLAAGVFILMGR
ncbi:MAG: hypothetical protein WB819_03665 [Terriglobia bacterium]